MENLNSKKIQHQLKNGKDIKIMDANIFGILDFTKINTKKDSIPDHEITNIHTKIVFRNCIFNDEVSGYVEKDHKINITVFTQKIYFNNCQFNKKIDFRNVYFHEECYFENNSFSDDVIFDKCIFSKNVYFNHSQFSKSTFINTLFKENIFFNDINFNNNSYFKDAIFEGDANFRRVVFNGITDFGTTSFRNAVDFSFSYFNNNSIFDDSIFEGKSLFQLINVSDKMSFNNIKCLDALEISIDKISNPKKIDFRKITIPGKIIIQNSNLTNFYFLNSSIHSFDFQNVIWNEETNLIILADETQLRSIQGIEILDCLNSMETLYRSLKNHYSQLQNIRLADMFYSSELKVRIKKNKLIKNTIKNIKSKFNITMRIKPDNQLHKQSEIRNQLLLLRNSMKKKFIWEKLYWIVSHFGMSWWHPWIFIFSIIILCSFITWIETGFKYNNTLILREFDITQNEYVIDTQNKLKPEFWSTFVYSLYFHIKNSFFISLDDLMVIGKITLILMKIEQILITTLLIISGFAIRRKFKT